MIPIYPPNWRFSLAQCTRYQGFDNVSYLRDGFRWLDQAIDRYLKKGSWSVVALCFDRLISITANESVNHRERVQSFQDYLRKRVNLLDHIDALKPDVQKRIIWNLQVALAWALDPHVPNSEKDLSEWGPIGEKIYKAANNLLEHCRQEKHYALERQLLGTKSVLSELLNRDNEEEIIVRLAENHEAEGDRLDGKRRVSHYIQAYNSYAYVGEQNKLKRVMDKLRQALNRESLTDTLLKPVMRDEERLQIYSEVVDAVYNRSSFTRGRAVVVFIDPLAKRPRRFGHRHSILRVSPSTLLSEGEPLPTGLMQALGDVPAKQISFARPWEVVKLMFMGATVREGGAFITLGVIKPLNTDNVEVLASIHYGNRGASGSRYNLTKHDNKWSINKRDMTWQA